MCLSYYNFTLIVYVIALNFFWLFVRYVSFHDYFECFACKEMDSSKESFDYIVVGSGSAGSIVARRLIEDKDIKVLLIEAGGYGGGLLEIPAFGPMLQKTNFDWQYQTVPQKKACLGLDNKASSWPMGKIVGGTSMLNNMIYVRGHPEDFARWYQNKTDFNYDIDILPYFKKLESFSYNNEKASVIISDVPHVSSLAHNIIRAAKCAQIPVTDGIDSEPGYAFAKATMHNGHRWTPWHRLQSIKKKPNLLIFPNSLVEKVLFRADYEAYGVRYVHLDETHEVKASKGVILAAGVIGTPKILMLSGIGPRKHLKKIGIKPIRDLPVGDNLQDHVTTGFDLMVVDTPIGLGINDILSPFSAYEYFIKSKGPWTTTGCENIAFFSSDPAKAPNLQFMVLPLGVSVDNGTFLRTLVGIGDKLYKDYFYNNKSTFTILPIVLHPRSRGTIRLKSKNPKTPPLIDPNYLSDDYDVQMLIQGIQEIKKLLQTSPMQKLGVRLNDKSFPGCEKLSFDTSEYWECYIRHLTITSYHPVGTCKLGEVVDYNFQVIGTSKLFVVDGSILPDLPSGNPNAAIMMMAEKASSVIKEQQWLSRNKSNASDILLQKRCC